MKPNIEIYQELLDEFYSKKQYLDLIKSDAHSVSESYSFVEKTLNQAFNQLDGQFKQIKTGIIAQYISLSFLTMECLDKDKEESILKEDYPANDFQLGCHLIEISNTVISILQLCSNGFDLQARILLRNLEERLMQIIVLFTHNQDFIDWLAAQEVEESKTVNYNIFAKKGSLIKKYGLIEKEILQDFDFKVSREHELNMRKFRKERSENLSMSVHGASTEVYLRSYKLLNHDSEKLIPSFLGTDNFYSLELINETFESMWYFLKLFRLLLFKYHFWEQDLNKPNIIAFEFYRFINHKIMVDIAEEIENT